MDIVSIVLGITFGLIVLSIIVIAAYGAMNIVGGKHEVQKVVAILVPFVIFGISYGVTGDLAEAGIGATLLMMVLLALFILFSGLRKTFKF